MKNYLLLLSLSALLFVGCSSHPDPIDNNSKTPILPETQANAHYAGVKDFHFTLSPAGAGEWHLEPMLTASRIDVTGKKVYASFDDIPYVGSKSSVEMVNDHVLVEGAYDPWNGELDAKYTITNTEKSGGTTYTQAGHGTLKGKMAQDGKTITVEVDGTRTNVTTEGAREGSHIDKTTKYTFTAQVIE